MKLHYFSVMLVAAMAAIACQPQDNFEPKLEVNEITLTGGAVSVEAVGTSLSFSVNSNVSYTISSDKDWVEITPPSVENNDKKDLKKTITVKINPNTAEEARSAKVKIAPDGNSALDYTFTINQAAAKHDKSLEVLTTGLEAVTEINAEAAAVSAPIMVVSTVSWTAASNVSWITIDPSSVTVENYEETPTAVKINIAANPGTEPRDGTVTFVGEGVDPVTLSVSQDARIVYTFDVNVTDITTSSATIACTPSDQNVHYLISCESPRYVNQFASGEELAAADIEYFRNRYGSIYEELGFTSFEDLFLRSLCVTGSKAASFDQLDSSTDYIAYVFAVDSELNVISDVFKKAFRTEEEVASEEYKKWLGNYTLATKSLKTAADTTYNVSLSFGIGDEVIRLNGLGVDGMPLHWNSEDNTCTIKFGNYASNDRYNFYSSGITNYNYVCNGDPETGVICTLTKDANNVISINSAVYNVEDMPNVYAVYWGTLGTDKTGENWYTFNDVKYVVNPSTMSPAASSSSKSLRHPLKKGLFTGLTAKMHPMSVANCVELR